MTTNAQKFNWEEKSWKLLNYMFDDKKVLVAHNIDSFNHFMKTDIYNIINEPELNPVRETLDYNPDKTVKTAEYEVRFGDIYFGRPVINETSGIVRPMYPNDARLRDLTYSATLYIDLHHRLIERNPKTGEETITDYPTISKHSIGKLPIMVGSDFCILSDKTTLTKAEMGEGEYDYGGYFIVKGTERTLVNIEKRVENKPTVFPVPRVKRQKFSNICEVSSVPYGSRAIPKTTRVMMSTKGNRISVYINRFKKEIPLFVVFRALGIMTDEEIVKIIAPNMQTSLIRLLRGSIEEASMITTQQSALEYLVLYSQWSTNYKSVGIELQTGGGDNEENEEENSETKADENDEVDEAVEGKSEEKPKNNTKNKRGRKKKE